MFSSLETPYLTPSSDTLVAQPWQISLDDESRDLPEFISSWAQGTDLKLHRVIEIDRDRILEEAGLPPDCKIAVAVTWMSDTTKIRRCVFRSQIDGNPLNVAVKLNGDEIGGRIVLQTSVILHENLNAVPPWVAHEVGSILLIEKFKVALEGEGAVFPMAVVDFSKTSYPPLASWHLVVSDELEARFSSTFQVMINEADKRLVKAVEAIKPTKEQTALLDSMMGGVIASILEFAYTLRTQGLLELDGYEEGTVGNILAGFIVKTQEQNIRILPEPNKLSQQRAIFESLAREIGAGRSFE